MVSSVMTCGLARTTIGANSGGLFDAQPDIQRPGAPAHQQRDAAPLLELSDRLVELVDVLHVLVVHRQYHVAAADAGPRRRALGILNQNAAAHLQLLALLGGQLGQRHAQLNRRFRRGLTAPGRALSGALVRHFADDQVQLLGGLVAQNFQSDLGTGLGSAYQAHQVVGRAHRLAGEFQDDVTPFDTGLLGRTPRLARVDQCPGRTRQAERFRHFLGDRLNAHADATAAYSAARAQLIGNVDCNIDRDGERQTHETAGAAVYLRVDADHFALQVEQRPARVAGIHRDIGLNERHEVLLRQRASLGADDACGHAIVEAEWAAYGNHPFADLQLVRIAYIHLRQAARFDLDERDVGFAVCANDLGLELALVGQLDGYLVGGIDHVCIGEHVAVAGDNEARAERIRFEIARPRVRRHEATEKFVEWIILRHVRHVRHTRHLRSAARCARCLGGADVDYGGSLLLDEVGEVRQLARGGKRQQQRESEQRIPDHDYPYDVNPEAGWIL